MSLMLMFALAAFSSQAATPRTEPDPKANKVICKSSGTTGTRLRRPSVCRTRAEWDAIAEDTRKRMDEYRGNPRASGSSGF
jgi:hypothetical protein